MAADQNRDRGCAQYSGDREFARLAEHFESLRALPSPHRDRALQALAVEDPGLTTALRLLFAQHVDDPDELSSPERAFARDLLVDAVSQAGTPLPMPPAIGPYRPLRELGRGGMGTVYLAERQHADFRQQVAIKVLRAGRDDRDLQRRFRTERRILASLQHPNIASMIDGGTTDEGQLFVVMEYVDGTDLLTHCTLRRARVADRLRLFAKVCRAVAHAHRSLVVHRDLKPGNVLVTADGEPKLLDFGIAKLLQRDPASATLTVTLAGHMLLTPEYCSPEQVRDGNITTASDVYALGTMLYELLCGQRAQPVPDRSLPELLRIVCDRSPPAPSAVVLAASAPLQGRPETRKRLGRLLRGDLDTIVACAMRKEPERRYGSATALAEDIERHLAGVPVAARGDGFGYRARKLLQRHRLPFAAAVLLLSMLVGFAVVTAVQNRRIARERDTAITQRAVADQIANFLVDLYQMASPDPERAEAVRARELLDRGARRIDTELGAFPERKASLQLAMGRAYLSLGLYAPADPLLTAAEQAFSTLSHGGSDHRQAQYALGVLRMQQASAAEGERLLRAALQATDGQPLDAVVQGCRRLTLAGWLREAGRFDEAEALLLEAERLAGARAAEIQLDGLDLELTRARIQRERGDFATALATAQAALRAAQLRDGGSHPRHSRLHHELGLVHKHVGNLDTARAELTRALELDRAVSGDEHPDVDSDLFALAMLEIDLGDRQRAETLLREILARDERRFGPRHPYPALVRGQLAMVLGNLGRIEEAEAMFVQALALQRELLPGDHPEVATTASNLGNFYHRSRRPELAAPLSAEALAMRLRLYPEDHPAVLSARNQVAVIELERGNTAEAEAQLRAVLDVRRRVLGTHVEVAGSLYNVATAVARQDRHADAVPLFVESLLIFRQTAPSSHPDLARPLTGLAFSHMRLGQPGEAEPLLREAVQVRSTALGQDHVDTLQAQWLLARCFAEQKRLDDAIPLLRELLGRLHVHHPDHRLTRDVRAALAALLEQQGDAAGAAEVRGR